MKLLEKWMKDYEQRRLEKLQLTLSLMKEWETQKRSQKSLDVNYRSYHLESEPVMIPEMKNHCGATISPNWKRIEEEYTKVDYSGSGRCVKTVKTNIIVDQINIGGVFYEDYVTGGDYFKMKQKYNGYEKLLRNHGCNMTDEQWLAIGRTDEDISNKAHKDMLEQKKAIEDKVRKICGETLVEVEDSTGEIYAKGSNGRTAHVWAIYAGGYNQDVIVNERKGQCLHIRVLVKEVK